MYNCQNSNFVLCDTIDALIKAKVLDYFETKVDLTLFEEILAQCHLLRGAC